MKIKKFVKKSLIVLFSSFIMLLSGVLKSENVEVVDADDTIQELSVSASYDSTNTYFMPNQNTGVISITISVPNNVSNDVSIYYHAEDRTAVAEAGDYYFSNQTGTNKEKAEAVHKSNTAVIEEGSNSTTIYYQTNTDCLTTYNSDGVNYSTFMFVLEGASGASLPETTKYECCCKYNQSIRIVENSSSSGYMLWPYAYTWERKISTGDMNDDNGHSRNYAGSLIYDILDTDSNYRSEALKYIIDGNLGYLYSSLYCDCEIGIWNMNDFIFRYYGYTKNDKNLVGSRTFDWVTDGDNDYVDPAGGVKHIGDYLEFKRSYKDYYHIYVYNESAWNRWAYLTMKTRFYDVDYASITNSYIDTSSLNTDGIIRLALRFNEPVQVKSTSDDIYVIGFANGSVDSIKFHYKGGSLTNTLYFEASIRTDDLEVKDAVITKVDLDYFGGVKNISDLGYNYTGKNNFYNNSHVGSLFTNSNSNPECNVDIRVPKITCSSTNTNYIATIHEVPITVSSCKAGTLYYKWTTESDFTSTDSKDYDSGTIQLESSSNSTHELTIVGEGTQLYGEQYLYVLVESETKRYATYKVGRRDGTSTNIGGFLFDTIQPTVDNIEVINDTPKSKTFAFDITEKTNIYDSILSQIYLAYKTSENGAVQTKLIWENGITADLPIGSSGYYIPSNLCYYYSVDGGVATCKPSYYNNSTKYQLFSSAQKAREYIEFIECKDFKLVKVTSTDIAQTISSKYGAGESRNPETNDWWIIYKNPNSYNVSSPNVNGYSYYFYKNDSADITEIDYNLISNNLKNAVKAIASVIVEKGGKFEAKTNCSTTDNILDIAINADGKPDITSDQYHKEVETITTFSNVNITNLSYSDTMLFMGSRGGKSTYKVDYSTLGLQENSFSDYYIGFYAVDAADVRDNKISSSSIYENIEFNKYYYDSRDVFDCTLDVSQGNNSVESIDNKVTTYNLVNQNGVKSSLTFEFTATGQDTSPVHDLQIKYIKYQGVELDLNDLEAIEDILVINHVDGEANISILIKVSGKIDIELQLKTGDNSYKYHQAYSFYVTNDYEDNTTNNVNSKETAVLNNIVYELQTVYEYMDVSGNILPISYNLPVNGVTSQKYSTFSSVAKAKEYIKYMEQRDFYFYVLSANAAQALNNPNPDVTFNKAEGDEKYDAQAGQVWIRYKARDYSSDNKKYVYYFYSDTNTVYSLTSIKSTLETALSDNVTRILNSCKAKYLVGYNGVDGINDNFVDKYGSPYLELSQQHYAKESTRTTMTGNSLLNELVYSGDSELYKNTIHSSSLNEDISICTNKALVDDGTTSLFYAVYNGSIDIFNNGRIVSSELKKLDWKEAKTFNNKTYKEILSSQNLNSNVQLASGTYCILEYGKMGASVYFIYIDLEAPLVNVLQENAVTGELSTRNFDKDNNGQTYNVKSLILSDLNMYTEFDTLAYVSVYSIISKSNIERINTYFFDYLKDPLNQVVIDSTYDPNNEYGRYLVVVSDRSGNAYHFYVNVAKEELIAEVSVSDDNTHVTFKTNREQDQIFTFKVLVNDVEVKDYKPITSATSKGVSYSFDQEGYYIFKIVDIYGFEKEFKGEGGQGVNFERPIPTGSWLYIDEDGSSHSVDEEDSRYVKFVKGLGSTTYISTAQYLRFTFDDKFDYKVEGLETGEYEVKNSINGGTNSFTTKVKKNWTLTVYYHDYESSCVTFICSIDNEAPTIDVSYKTNSYALEEDSYIQNLTSSVPLGTIYVPQGISYKTDTFTTQHVKNKETLFASIMNVSLSDVSGIYDVVVKLNNEVIYSYCVKDGAIPHITLSKYGYYEITSHDTFGNESVLTFTNAKKEYAEYSVDNNNVTSSLTNTYFGSNNVVLKMNEDGVVAVKVTLKDGTPKVLFFKVVGNKVYSANYIYSQLEYMDTEVEAYQLKINKVSSGNGLVDDVVFVADDSSNRANTWIQKYFTYGENKELLDKLNLSFMYEVDGNGNTTIYFKVDMNDVYSKVELRASFDTEIEPYYISCYLSDQESNVDLFYKKDDKKITKEEGIVTVNNEFYIDPSIINVYAKDLLGNDITSNKYIKEIIVSYSTVNSFTTYDTIYSLEKGDTAIKAFSTKENGFYYIKVINVFNNEEVIIINRSDTFTVETVAIYNDATTNTYSTKYANDTKSNDKVLVKAYTNGKNPFTVKLNNVAYEIVPTYENGIYTLTLFKEGVYEVTCVDKFGNIVVKNIEIKHSDFVLDENLIYGYNEQALLKASGYTNKKLSIDESVANALKVKYVSLMFNQTEYIVFDLLTENVKAIEANKLVSCIGNNGTGVYTVFIRDEFGNVAKKIIHYREENTLEVLRRTSSAINDEKLSLESIIQKGAYSNYELIFNSEASVYKFKIDGVEYNCPYELQIEILTGYAKYSYDISYVDEYGFTANFKSHLERNKLEFSIPESLDIKTINNVLTTKKVVQLEFTNDDTVSCYYQFSNNEKVPYTSLAKLYEDGIYTFTLEDLAGNITTLRINKDTYVYFEFVASQTERNLISGEVTNSKEVRFVTSSKDDVSIKEYYLDGVKMEYKGETSFSEHGHYAFLVEDKVGNKRMFEFYIIRHSVESFTYNTPDTFKIKKLFYNPGDGSSVNLLNSEYVSQYDSTSRLNAKLNGTYTVVMESTVYKTSVEYEILINNIAPDVSLVGCDEGEKTIEDVSITGYEVGDTIYVYKNGKLTDTVEVTSSSIQSPVISEGGDYEIKVVNESGVSKSLRFRHIYVPNVSGSILIIILSLGIAGGIITGVIIRNKQKFDE